MGSLYDMVGETVTLFGMNYIYTGLLVHVDERSVELTAAKIVYETGPLDSPAWHDAQSLPNNWHVAMSAIESWGILKC